MLSQLTGKNKQRKELDQFLLVQSYIILTAAEKIFVPNQGPVVQSVVSLTSLLRVISLTVLADSIHNILKFFAEKM